MHKKCRVSHCAVILCIFYVQNMESYEVIKHTANICFAMAQIFYYKKLSLSAVDRRSADRQHILQGLTLWAKRRFRGFSDSDDSHDVLFFRDGEEFANGVGIADAHDKC